MRFKVDENLPIDVAEILRANNHDAMTIFDQEMVGQPDLKVAVRRCRTFWKKAFENSALLG